MRSRTPQELKEREERRAYIQGRPVKSPKFKKPMKKKSAKQKLIDTQDAKNRLMLIERDGPHCAVCGLLGDHAHHILTKARYPELRDDPYNLIFLCHICHADAHSCPSAFFDWLKNVLSEQYAALNIDNARATKL